MATRNKRAAPVAPPVATRRSKATPTLRGRIGPDLSGGEATFNPDREGRVLAAIRNGEGGGTTAGIVSATGLRVPTVTYFAKEASEGGSAPIPLIETVRFGRESYFLPLATDRKASAKGKDVRKLVLSLRKAGEAPAPKAEKAERKARAPRKARTATETAPAADAVPEGAPTS